MAWLCKLTLAKQGPRTGGKKFNTEHWKTRATLYEISGPQYIA